MSQKTTESSTSSAAKVTHALKVLGDIQEKRDEEIAKYSSEAIHDESDIESDSKSPLFDRFYANGGSKTLLQMTNFNCREIDHLWHRCCTVLNEKFTLGRGKKTDVSPKDILFIVLCVVKTPTNWDLMGEIFEKKGPTLQRLFSRAVDILSPILYQDYVLDCFAKLSMTTLINKKAQFKNFPCALYATDVIFQQANRPSGNMLEGKHYFSGKHKLYGFKTEVSVTPSGQAVDVTDHSAGSISDFVIFRNNLNFHNQALKKFGDDTKIADDIEMSSKFPDSWAILMDKGYQGAHQYVRAIIPKKKPHGKMISIEDASWNATVSSDRIIVENFFGRLTKLWGIIASKFKWGEESYDALFRLCVALTNYHISLHPLRDEEDAAHYTRYNNRNFVIGEKLATKRKMTQKKYREKRRKRIEQDMGVSKDGSSIDSGEGS